MPLVRGTSRSARSRNIRLLRHEGYPQKQAVAIALRQSRKGEKSFSLGEEPALGFTLWWMGAAGAAAAVWLLASKTAPATEAAPLDPVENMSGEQKRIAGLVAKEAGLQGVPVELALAFADLESGFKNVKAPNAASYGPLQVHVSALQAGETEAMLQNMSFSIPRGISILKKYLGLAGGVSLDARLIYFCGYKGWKTLCTATVTSGCCSQAARDRVTARWKIAAAKWGVKVRY